MATPKTIFSEIFYHVTSALRFELGSYRDATKFKIELIPQAKDANGNAIEKKFNYDDKLTMVFGSGEILRMKKFVENLLNPAKTNIPKFSIGTSEREGYQIEHYFEVNGEKKKSVISFTRLDNLLAKKPDIYAKSPYQFKYSVGVSLYSSLKNNSVSFILSEEEAYFIMNMSPSFVGEYMKENMRIVDENRAIKAQGGQVAEQGKKFNTPAPGADTGAIPETGGINEDLDLGDIPF